MATSRDFSTPISAGACMVKDSAVQVETILSAARWQVVFRRDGDRFAHEIRWLAASGEAHVLLASQEGAAQDDWPPSPPLQELHLERRSDDLTVALLVGMAGSSHWSLVVEAYAREERLVFEAACRVHGAPNLLGSRYRAGAGTTMATQTAGQVLRLEGAGETWRLESESLEDSTCAALNCDQGGDLAFSPELREVKRPQTFRWRYTLIRIATA